MTTLKTESLKYCRPLVRTVLQKLNERFRSYFNIEGEGINAAITAMTHPEIKNRWFTLLTHEMQQKIENLVFAAAEREEPSVTLGNQDEDIMLRDDFSNGTNLPNNNTFESIFSTSDTSEMEVLKYLSLPCTKNYSVLHQFPTVKKLFLKFNTPLPSSAPVERLFN